MQLEEDRDIGEECTTRPCAPGLKFSAEIFNSGGGGIFEGEECDQGIQSAYEYEEAILGSALLGGGILCEHRRT